MRRRKEQVNATVSPLSVRQLDALVGSDTLLIGPWVENKLVHGTPAQKRKAAFLKIVAGVE